VASSNFGYLNPQSSQIYGVDLRLDTYGDITISNFGDLDTLKGNDNLVQAITHRLKTEVGDLIYDSSYGVDLANLIGRKNILEKVTMIKKSVEEALLSDPRIQGIISIDVLQDVSNPSILYVDVTALPINSQTPFSINMVFPWFTDSVTYPNLSTITSESAVSRTKLEVKTLYSIYNCSGVWLSSDTGRSGTNYFTGGYIDRNVIRLGEALPTTSTNVVIDYSTLDTVYSEISVTQILNELTVSSSARALMVVSPIYDVSWIGLASDIYHLGTNYWMTLGGTFVKNIITLDGDLPGTQVSLLVDYSTSVRT
jgi:phage baseplate assembly protein W